MELSLPVEKNRKNTSTYSALIFLAGVVFSVIFLGVNWLSTRLLSPIFEANSSDTMWGIIQRLFLIIPCFVVVIWYPRQIGFTLGKTFQYWKMVLIILAVNVAVVGGYTLLSGGTPYSGIDMLFNEVVTVPLVEEVVWRGVVFAAMLAALRRFMPEDRAGMQAAVFSGLCFGLLHANNILYGYPAAFVALQTLNATVWGLVYGIARAKTGSIYPSILFHAAMNLVVVLA